MIPVSLEYMIALERNEGVIDMVEAHLKALKKRHAELDEKIHKELTHSARNELSIRRMKEQKLHVKEEIERLHATG